MRITTAWNVEMQALAENADVMAVVEAAEIPGAFQVIAILIRDYAARDIDRLTDALDRVGTILPALLMPQETDDIEDLVRQIIEAVRALYLNAKNEADLTLRRAKVVELTLYRRIAPMYAGEDCLMDCVIYGDVPNPHFKNIENREFDLCAWDEAELSGEAYECGIWPNLLKHRDCQALVHLLKAVELEYDGDEIWFRIGLVSFHNHKEMYQRVKYLAGSDTRDQREFDWLHLYGYDNIDDVTR